MFQDRTMPVFSLEILRKGFGGGRFQRGELGWLRGGSGSGAGCRGERWTGARRITRPVLVVVAVEWLKR